MGRGVAENQARLRETDRPETAGGSRLRVAGEVTEAGPEVLTSAGAPFQLPAGSAPGPAGTRRTCRTRWGDGQGRKEAEMAQSLEEQRGEAR